MSKRLYIKNLPFSVEEEVLGTAIYEVLSAFGTVMALTCLCEGSKEHPKGVWFAEMASPFEAQVAIDNLDGVRIAGRKIKVATASPLMCRPPRRPFRPQGELGDGPKRKPTQLLLISR